MSAVAACELDFDTPIVKGKGAGVNEDGLVEACVVQRSWLHAWCQAHPGATLDDLKGLPVPDDEPTISPVLRSFAIAFNDGVDDETRQRLRPYEERLLGTRGDDAAEARRAWMATDWLVRTFTPTWLRKCGLADRAAELEALDELTSAALAKAAQPIIEKAPAGAAAGAAARDAAGDAASKKKGYDAQYRAARAAADAVLAEALGDTITELREDALRLFARMIDLTPVAV